jgi:lipopolysaccharide transport system ATP-binding protein
MSSDTDIAISARGLSKMYTLYSNPQDRLKHTLFWRFGKTYGHSFWALNDVSFDLKRGETFGVIGRNGSGKSTLLQILAGILTPTQGSLEVNGRISALLELGSGFNPEFTGRENVVLYGKILGISRENMQSHMDEILAFADIGEFIDQPVKLYSSGMFVRLAFAVAAGVDADILLIDEALAVGDVFFRQKCYQRLEDLRQNGATIILVSHAMNEVEQFCDRALILSDGHPFFLGSAIEAVKRYYFIDQQFVPQVEERISKETIYMPGNDSDQGDFHWPDPSTYLDIHERTQITGGLADCTVIAICDATGRASGSFEQGEIASFFYEFELHQDIEVPIGGVEIVNDKGVIIHGKNSLQCDLTIPLRVPKGSRVGFRQDIKMDIAVGEYSFNIGFSCIRASDYQLRGRFAHPDLNSKVTVLCVVPKAGNFVVLHRSNREPTQLLYFGLADLPGKFLVSVSGNPSPLTGRVGTANGS